MRYLLCFTYCVTTWGAPNPAINFHGIPRSGGQWRDDFREDVDEGRGGKGARGTPGQRGVEQSETGAFGQRTW